MGFRTIVAFSNDRSSDWSNDPELGRKIMNGAFRGTERNTELSVQGVSIVECVHGDTQSLIVADGYDAEPVAYEHWHRDQTKADRDLALLREFARKLGYNISKKPAPKSR